MTEGRPVDVALLRRFSPLDGMKNENLMASPLVGQSARRQPHPVPRCDAARRTIWLVSGLLELREASARWRDQGRQP
jgi:hypothetical protein